MRFNSAWAGYGCGSDQDRFQSSALKAGLAIEARPGFYNGFVPGAVGAMLVLVVVVVCVWGEGDPVLEFTVAQTHRYPFHVDSNSTSTLL